MKALTQLIPSAVPYSINEKPQVIEYEVRGRKFGLDVNTLALIQMDQAETLDDAPPANDFRAFVKPRFPCGSMYDPRYLILEACHSCNLRCDYCFEQSYSDDRKPLSFQVAKEAINLFFLKSVPPGEESQLRRPIRIGFFGGEPLMNWPLIEAVVAYCEGLTHPNHGVYHVTTNGTLIDDEKARFLCDNNFSFIISVDGPAHVHNVHRKGPDGSGSFDKTIAGLRTLLKHRGLPVGITLRGTYTPDTASHLLESVKYLNKLREEGLASWVSVEPAFLTESMCVDPAKAKESVHHADFDLLEDQYMAVVDWMLEEIRAGRPMPVMHNITKPAERLLYRMPYGTECGAGTGYFSVAPDGGIYACHREGKTGVGNILRGGIDEELRAKWVDNRIYHRKDCMACSIRYICGGGCREEGLNEHDDITRAFRPACRLRMTWVKAASWLLSELGYDEAKKHIKEPPAVAQARERFEANKGTNMKTIDPCEVCSGDRSS